MHTVRCDLILTEAAECQTTKEREVCGSRNLHEHTTTVCVQVLKFHSYWDCRASHNIKSEAVQKVSMHDVKKTSIRGRIKYHIYDYVQDNATIQTAVSYKWELLLEQWSWARNALVSRPATEALSGNIVFNSWKFHKVIQIWSTKLFCMFKYLEQSKC